MILFKINSKTLSRNPTDIEQSKFRIEKSDRTIDGTLVVDIIATKNKVTFAWNHMSDSDLKKLLQEINASTFVTVEYADPDAGVGLKSLVGESGDLSYKPHYNTQSQRVEWKDVKVSFTER